MKTTKLIYSFAAAALLGLGSCSGFLDTPTDTRVELKTPEQLRMLLTSSYPQANYNWICEIMTDNMEDNNAPDDDGMRYNLSPYNRGDDEMFRFEQCVSNSGNESPFQVWEAMYGSIASANHVLEAADKMLAAEPDPADKLKLYAIRGEALMIRSYGHFILAQIFCQPFGGWEKSKTLLGIPYADAPETTVNPQYDRGTLAETYEKIVKDFEEGVKLIDNTLYDQPKYHFNSTAAYAYGARLYLFMRQYNKAYNYANLAFGADRPVDIDKADTSNAMDAKQYLSDAFSKLGDFYYISDFGYYVNAIDKSGNFLLYATYSTSWRHFIGGNRYGVIRNAINSTIHGSSPAWSSFKWVSTKGTGGSFTMHPCYNGSCGTNGKSDYGMYCAMNSHEFFEYTDKVAGIGYCHNTRREFYGEETLLVRAEARLMLGDKQGALDDISLWERNRRDCPSAKGSENLFKDLTFDRIEKFYVTNVPADRNQTKGNDSGYGICKEINIDRICPETDAKVAAASVDGMLQCIQHFRRLETIHTGLRWFDIKRFGLEYSHFVGKENTEYHLGIEDERKAIQIPSDVIAAGLQANPRIEPVPIKDNSEEYILVIEK